MRTMFTVHPYAAPRSQLTTWWVRDARDPKWPIGPYQTREQAEIIARGANASVEYLSPRGDA